MEIRKAAADKGILYIITDYVLLTVDEKQKMQMNFLKNGCNSI